MTASSQPALPSSKPVATSTNAMPPAPSATAIRRRPCHWSTSAFARAVDCGSAITDLRRSKRLYGNVATSDQPASKTRFEIRVRAGLEARIEAARHVDAEQSVEHRQA